MKTHKKEHLTVATVLASVLAISALTAMAQYSINWSTIDGGGVEMSGGNYSVNGTIGQHDADQMTGGDYEVDGGFWVPQAVQVEDAPFLEIIYVAPGNVSISWNATAGWLLQETSSLTNSWVDSASGVTNPVTIPATNAAMFYKLRKQ